MPLLVVQWLALLAFAVTVRHNGWLYYQGGDQSYYWTGSYLLTKGTLPITVVGYAWSYLLMPVALVAGANVLSGLPAVIVLNALVLVPLALLCVYGIATRIAGRVFGYWAAALWILVPYLAIPLFDHRYHQKYVEIVLPQQLGLTVLGDFPSMVCLLVTAYLIVRALDSGDWRDTVLAGLAGAFAIGIKPSNTLFFGAAVLCLLVARRWLQTGAFLAAMIPGLVVLALWKQRGLGQLPAFSSYGGDNGHLAAAGASLPLKSLTTPFHKYVSVNWGHLQENLDGLREFFWAVRPLEFVPFAGLLAIGRRSWPKALLVFFWLATFLAIKGTDIKANVEDASFFRLMMPSFPAFLLLLAAIPLLVPAFRWSRRLFTEGPALSRGPGRWTLGGAAAVLVALPLILIAAASPQSKPVAVTYAREDVYVPVVGSFGLQVRGAGRHKHLTWQAPYSGPTGVFYTVFRAPLVAPDPTSGNGERKTVQGIACRDRQNGSSLDCLLFMKRLTTQPETTYVDRPKKGRWTYRVGLTANWLNDPSLGDLMLLSPPVTISVP